MLTHIEVIDKPWGKEEVLEINKKYMLKRLTMLKGHRCSLQYHNLKIESIYIISGLLNIYTKDSNGKLIAKTYKSNDFITLQPLEVHRMEGVEDCVYLEASTPEMDDVVRISDDYNRKS